MKNVVIFVVLLLLAVVPVSLTLLSSGDEPDAVPTSTGEDEEAFGAEEETQVAPVAPPPVVPQLPPSAEPSAMPPPVVPQPPPRAVSPVVSKPRASAAAPERESVPTFPGFGAARYQQHDDVISKLVAEFNARRGDWCGGTPEQAARVGKLTAAQVKAHMIQETGGGDVISRAAWTKDPLQVNVPGDWNPYKSYLGLRQPRKRNEGSFEKNLKAGIMLLVRKGFGKSGQPAGNQPTSTFDGWRTSLRRYNGRTDLAADGRAYAEVYADRVLKRSASRKDEVPIQIPTKKR